MKQLCVGITALVLVTACDPTEQADAGAETDAGLAREEAAMPNLLPCPDGWLETVSSGVAVCDPTRGVVPAGCGPGEAFFPGTSGCTRVGRACPSGEFADDLPATGVLFVAPGGSGDGTRAAPFGAIANALAVATSGSTIALARGTYDEPLLLRSGVTVRGACAAETRLSWSTPRGPSGSVGAGAGVTDAVVSDLSIASSDNIGVLAEGSVRLEGVVIEDAMLFGVAVIGGDVAIEGSIVRRTRRAPDGSQGGGLVVASGGALDATRLVVEQNHQFGIAVGEGSRADLRDVASRSQAPGSVAGLGAGIVAESGGVLTGARIELTGALGAAAFASAGGVLDLSDAVVRGARGLSAQGFGLAASGGVVRGTRVWSTDNHGTSVSMLEGAELALTDAVVDATVETTSMPGWAVGVVVSRRSHGRLERVRVTDGAAAGVAVLGVPTDERGNTTLVAVDLSIADMEDRGTSGVGLYVSDGADADVQRLAIERTVEAAIVVASDSHLSLQHARVDDTRPDPDAGEYGRGLEVTDRSDVEVEHAYFSRQHEVAVVFGGGRSTLRDVEIRDTLERGCASTTCADAPGGIGVGVYLSAEVTLQDFVIDGAPLCGVQLASSGQLDLHDGEIANATVGACVQVAGYDVTRLADGVAYRATGTSIQSTELYVPMPRDPLAP